jgi:hypothetical protein
MKTLPLKHGIKAGTFGASAIAIIVATLGAVAAGQGSYRPEAESISGIRPGGAATAPAMPATERAAAEAESSPGAAATEPAATRGASTQPAAEGALAQVEEQLRLGDHDLQMVAGIRDGTDWRGEPAFYMLLDRASKLPELTARQLHSLEKPTYDGPGGLLRDPARYRGNPNSANPGPMVPMQLKLRVCEVIKLSPGKGLEPNRYWSDKPIWLLNCEIASEENDAKEREAQEQSHPLVVFSVVKPPDLGPPDAVLPHGDKPEPDHFFYSKPKGVTIEVAAVFVKTWRTEDRGAKDLPNTPDRPAQTRTYPVVIAWQVTGGVEKVGTIDDEMGQWRFIIIGLILAGVIFFFFLLRNARRGHSHMATNSTPFRAVRAKMKEEREQARKKGILPDDGGEDPVDEDLARAAQEFKKRKGNEQGNDANSQS